MIMNIFLAPIQGVTIAPYRNYYNKIFGGIDAFYAPFISPTNKQETHPSFFDDVLPSMNQSPLVPQLLGNDGDNFRRYAKTLSDFGYKEINWNIGCSFSVVTRKKKGAGIMSHPNMIRDVLDEVCKDSTYDLSVKMRLGMTHVDEGIKVIDILNDYPIKNVIIHARTGIQQYKGDVDLGGFEALYQLSKHPVTYNGDIYTLSDYNNLIKRMPDLNNIMLGRGGLINPFLAGKIKGEIVSADQKLVMIKAFHSTIYHYYDRIKSRELQLLNKMKEFWTYMHVGLDNDHKLLKKLLLSQNIKEYSRVVDQLLNENNKWIEY